MKLSSLVSYLNHLERMDLMAGRQDLARIFDPITHTIEHHEIQFGDLGKNLRDAHNHINDTIDDFARVFNDIKKQVRSCIHNLESSYLQQSYSLYEQAQQHDTCEYILQRRPSLTDANKQYLRARLLRHSNWLYPGMIMRPGLEDWVDDLVGLDPLYLVDTDMQLLAPARDKFVDAYSNRLRLYVIREGIDHDMLAQLPQQQMALAFVYNYFQFKPLEIIRAMLSEIFKIMRPGGTVIFSFNDCDRSGAVELAERNFTCYTPGRLVLSAAEMMGFEIDHVYHIDAASTWVEMRRPGQLHSYRGGQALARLRIKDMGRHRVKKKKEKQA